LAQSTSNKRKAVRIHPPARLVGEPKKTKKKGKKEKEWHPKQWQTGYSPRPPTSSDQNQTLHGGWPAVCSYVKCDPNRLRGYGAVGGRKWPFPITLASALYSSLYYRTSRETIQNLSNCTTFNDLAWPLTGISRSWYRIDIKCLRNGTR